MESYLGGTSGTRTGALSGAHQLDAATAARAETFLHLDTGTTDHETPAEPWDGRRAVLQAEVHAALDAVIDERLPRARERKQAEHVPIEQLAGVPKQSQRAVEQRYGSLLNMAALTPSLRTKRDATPLTIVDAASTRPQPQHFASYLVRISPRTLDVMLAHHFDPERSDRERLVLEPVLRAAATARHDDLVDLERFSAMRTDIDRRSALTSTAVVGDTGRPAPGVPSPAERTMRWKLWMYLIHEFLHMCAHPAYSAAAEGRLVLVEGVCELLTMDVIEPLQAAARADTDPELRAGVEGTDADGHLFPGFDPTFIPDYDDSYAELVRGARAFAAVTGQDALKLAFFLGHVELVGLAPDGGRATPRGGAPGAVRTPRGVADLFSLATLTGSTTSAILAANPGLQADATLPPSVTVPGTSYHTLVDVTGGDTPGRVEAPDEVATCYGVSGADVRRANPGADWRRLRAGDQVLVPVHG